MSETVEEAEKLEAWVGVEPTVYGFANRSLSRSSTTPFRSMALNINAFSVKANHFSGKFTFFLDFMQIAV